jgi:hypothetical protein
LLLPAHGLTLAASAVASVLMNDPLPFMLGSGATALSVGFLVGNPRARRALEAGFNATRGEPATEVEERETLLADLSASQKDHFGLLTALKSRILERYRQLPGGRVLAASSEPRLDALLLAFLRLVVTLNSYRRFLGAADKASLEVELRELEADLAQETNERLREVKGRRVELLKKRLGRFVHAHESREVVSHQIASIEDLLRLTLEQSIAVRDPEMMGRQLDALTAEVAATEETVKEMEHFMQISEDFSQASQRHAEPVKVR